MNNLCWLLILQLLATVHANGEVVSIFNVNRSFQYPSFTHDILRHRRLFTMDLPLGGFGRMSGTPFYFTKIMVGSPPKAFYLYVDTGSDLTWLRCNHDTLYNPENSRTAGVIQCGHNLCNHTCVSGQPCYYELSYADGSSSTGYLVSDLAQLDIVSGDFTTSPLNSSVVLGCSLQESGNLKLFGARIDGLIGFGQSDLSFISQISASISIRKTFAHCLDNKNGGGIFLIGQVDTVRVKTSPLVQKRKHYTVVMEAVEVDKQMLQPANGGLHSMETVIDSGTTLAYLPEDIYKPLIKKIMSNHLDLKVYRIKENSQCFEYNTSIDAGFPTVTLHFEESLQLVVYPHDYLFEYQVDRYCVGWRDSGDLSKSFKDVAVLGDLVLSNKFIVYDIEKQAIGWTEYDCSSPIGVQDGQVGSNNLYAPPHITYAAHSHGTRSAAMLLIVSFSSLLFLQL